MITTPPDEDFNYCILAIMTVLMIISSANWWKFMHGGFPDPIATQAEKTQDSAK